MEDGDGGGDSTPFWVQSTANVRLRRRVSAVFLSSGLVVFLLLVTAVLFLVFVVPSSITFSSQIFRPNSVKKSWDSLNILLVLVAVVFGFLSRNKSEEKYEYHDEFKQDENRKPSTPNKWFKYDYDAVEGPKSNISNSTSSQWYEYSDYEAKLEQHKNSTLTRNSSSYPDLRDFSTAHWSYGDYYNQRRYYDDIHVDSGRVWGPEPDQGQRHRRHRSLEGVDHVGAPLQTKVVIVDTLSNKVPPPPARAPAEIDPKMSTSESAATGKDRLSRDLLPLDPISAEKPPQPPPAPEFEENPELTYERMVRRKERSSRKRNKDMEPKDPVSTPPQGPQQPPSPPRQKSTYRKRGGATGSSTKDFLNSLYHKRKKKQRQKSVDSLDPLLHEALSFQLPPPSHPPPPPPPPPPSVFQNLFSSKKHKRKRTITVTLAPQQPSPPQPPPPAAAREPEPTSHTAPSPANEPSEPIKMNSFNRLEETSNSGGESLLNRIPPPPPPPPAAFFKSPAWKFVVQGDYVRVNSSNSSRSGSPDTDDGESDVTPSAGDAAAFHPSPLFCASPDVNTKAESFITNFRAKLKLEKIHSMKKREVGLSGLGPGPGPSQFSQRN